MRRDEWSGQQATARHEDAFHYGQVATAVRGGTWNISELHKRLSECSELFLDNLLENSRQRNPTGGSSSRWQHRKILNSPPSVDTPNLQVHFQQSSLKKT